MGGSVFLTLFFGLFVAIGIGILGYGFHALNQAQQAAHWPTVEGRITASDFEIDSDSDGTTYRTRVAYDYNAMGRVMTGKTIAFGYAGSSSEKFHRDVYNALPVNTQVAVRYDPSNPERSVLSFGVNNSIIFMIIFGAVWTFFTFGLIAIFWLGGQGADKLLANMIIYSRG